MAWHKPNIAQAMQSLRLTSLPKPTLRLSTLPIHTRTNRRSYATEAESEASSTPAPAAQEINFGTFTQKPARIIPASPAYFSGSPRFIDHVLKLESLQAKYASLPTVAAGEAPRMAWFKLAQFRDYVGEPVPMKKYKSLVKILQRLNRIQPDTVPAEVRETLGSFLRPGNPYAVQNEPATLDEHGRARGKGKRKESSAVVQLVEGEGEVLINGKSLVEAFKRVHDRESALWALRATQRLDKYNVWATVRGGGVTGQAEAVTLAIARALMVHEPGLKGVLRKGMFLSISGSMLELVYSSGSIANFFFSSISWCYYCRCSSGREEEAWSRQGSQDAYLGQALRDGYCSLRFPLVHRAFWSFPLVSFPSCFYTVLFPPAMAPRVRELFYILYSQCIWGFQGLLN
jgi:small subunit ribosomal protein S9